MPNKVYYKVAVRLLIPAATLVAEKADLKCKPSELPIYSPEEPKQEMKLVREPGTLEKQIGTVRKQVVSVAKQVCDLQDDIYYYYDESKKQADWLIEYLREEENTVPRAGAIAVGGLAGFILALRGGFFRKLLFTSTGALGMAAVCYPQEAAEYSDIAKTETKKYMKIAYNFLYGGKLEDDEVLIAVPTLSKDIVIDTGESQAEATVTQIHDKASKDHCHCPIGTCLNPQDEVPPTHPAQ